MAEQVADLAFRVFGTRSVKDLMADIESHTEELLKSRGEESLLQDQISVAIDEPDPEAKFVEVRFTCKSKPALYACREVILPWLADKYKIIELAPEYSLEPAAAEATDVPAAGASSTAPAAANATGGIEAPLPFRSFLTLMNAHTELLKKESLTEDSTRPDFLEKVKQFINRGTVTGARLDDTDQRRTAQSLLNYWVTVLYRAEETPPPDAILAYYVPPENVGFDAGECPYLGLSPFQETDHERFFGRDQLTSDIVERLREKRLIVLVGPSGGGKTSVLNAGVLPTLKGGSQIPESKDWVFFPSIAPGADPLVQLASQFTEEPTPAAAALLKDPGHLVQLLKDQNFGEQTVVLIIDQFEELFTVCKDDPKREAFINCFLNLKDSAIEHRIILSMRSDRLNYIIRRPILNELFRDAEVRISPPGEVDLKAMIERPAQNIGLKFQPGIVEQLIRELLWDPVGLPLMQFTLLELWADRECDTISWAALNRVGNSRQALCNKAESFYQSLTQDEKAVARRILLRMVRLSDTWEATTEPVRREDLYQPVEDEQKVNLVLSKLLEMNLARISNVIYRSNSLANGVSTMAGAAALLSPDHQFELAHESLARSWPEIVGWLKRLREAMVTRQRLELFAANWVILGRGEKALLDTYQLRDAETWLATEESKELGYPPNLEGLVRQSRKALKRERLIKTVLISSSLGLLGFALIITGLFFYLEHGRLKTATSMRLAVQAIPNIPNQLDLALLLSLEAYRKDNGNREARNSLMRALTHSPKMSAYLHNQQGKIEQIAFNEDGSQLSVLGINGSVRLWDTVEHQPVGNTLEPRFKTGANSNSATAGNCSLLSHDGRWLVSLDEEGSLFIQSVEKPDKKQTKLVEKLECTDKPFQLAFSNDNKKLAWLTLDRTQKLKVRDIEKGTTVSLVPSVEVQSIAFSPNNRILAAANSEEDIVLLRTDNLMPIGKTLRAAFNKEKNQNRINFSKDGSRLASIKSNRELAVWDVQTQRELKSLKRHEVEAETGKPIAPSCFAISDTGDQLVAGFDPGSGGAAGSVVFWNIDTNEQAVYLPKDEASVTGVTFSPDQNRVLTLGGKEGPILWQKQSTESQTAPSWQDYVWMPLVGAVNPRQIELRSGRAAAVSRIAFSPNSKLAAGACEDGTIVLWDLEQKLMSRALDAKGIVDFQISGDNMLLARTESGEAAWFDLTGKKEVRKFSIAAGSTQPDGHRPQVKGAVINKNGTILAVSYSDNKVVVWDPLGSQKLEILDVAGRESANVRRIVMALDKEGKNLALFADAETEDRAIQLWNIDERRMQSLSDVHDDVLSLTFSPDGKTLAASGASGSIIVWDTAVKKQLYKLSDESVSPNSTLDFTSDGARLVSLSEDGTLRLWDLRTNIKQRLLSKSTANIIDFVLSPDLQKAVVSAGPNQTTSIAGVGSDGSIVFWDLDTWQEQFVFPSTEVFSLGAGSNLMTLVYSPDAKTLAARYANGTVSLIEVDIDSWIQRACPIANGNLTLPEWRNYRVYEDKAWRLNLPIIGKTEVELYNQFGKTCSLTDNRSRSGVSTGH